MKKSSYKKKLKTNLEYYHRNKDFINESRRKETHNIICEYKPCSKSKETSKCNQRFCSDKCRAKFNYEKKSKQRQAIKMKAIVSVVGKKATVKRVSYSPKEIKFIKDNLDKMRIVDIALELGRPYGGVVYKIGCIKKEIEERQRERELKKLYG